MAADKFIATEPLYIGRARAANPGDEVPAESIEKYGWDGKVAKAGTKAATAAAEVQTPDDSPPVQKK